MSDVQLELADLLRSKSDPNYMTYPAAVTIVGLFGNTILYLTDKERDDFAKKLATVYNLGFSEGMAYQRLENLPDFEPVFEGGLS